MIAQIIGAIMAILKAIFGMDKPATHEVKDAPAHPSTVDSDDKLLADLERLRSQYGAANKDGIHNRETGTPGPSGGTKDNPHDPT